jgi:hypothetical protein
MRIRRVVIVMALAWAGAAFEAGAQPRARAPEPAGAQPQTSAVAASGNADVAVRSSVSQTAMWVGDPVVFTVEIECSPSYDILVDDLSKEKLPLEGLELIDSETSRIQAESGAASYRFGYRVTTYETGNVPLRIGEMTVRYGRRRAGGRVEESAPAGEVRVVGATLALRSTLPDDASAAGTRDVEPLGRAPMSVRLARPVGLGLILLSAAPVVIWAIALLRRVRPKVRRQQTRAVRRQTRAALEELDLDTADEARRREAFTRLDGIVRQHLVDTANIPARALTPREVARRLSESGSKLPVEAIETVLADCERARYAPPSMLPSAERFRDNVSSAGQILAASR